MCTSPLTNLDGECRVRPNLRINFGISLDRRCCTAREEREEILDLGSTAAVRGDRRRFWDFQLDSQIRFFFFFINMASKMYITSHLPDLWLYCFLCLAARALTLFFWYVCVIWRMSVFFINLPKRLATLLSVIVYAPVRTVMSPQQTLKTWRQRICKSLRGETVRRETLILEREPRDVFIHSCCQNWGRTSQRGFTCFVGDHLKLVVRQTSSTHSAAPSN